MSTSRSWGVDGASSRERMSTLQQIALLRSAQIAGAIQPEGLQSPGRMTQREGPRCRPDSYFDKNRDDPFQIARDKKTERPKDGIGRDWS